MSPTCTIRNTTVRLLATGASALAMGFGAAQDVDVSKLVGGLQWAEPQAGRKAAEQILELGPEAIKQTARMLKPPGQGNDATARFALHGLAMHVVTGKAEAQRATLETGLLAALQEQPDPELKAFLIRQLQLAGREAAVPALAGYLSDERLCEPAVQALLAIKSPAAVAALRTAFGSAQAKRRLTIVCALGQLRDRESVPALLGLASSTDRDLRHAAWYSLANIGSAEAVSVLTAAASHENAYERSVGTRHLLLLAERLGAAGERAVAVPICRRLLDTRPTPSNRHTVCGALATLTDLLGADALPDVLKAVDAADWQVREAALRLATAMSGANATSQLAAKAESAADPAVRAAVVAALGSRADAAARAAVVARLKDDEPTVRHAAMDALPKLGVEAAIEPLIDIMTRGRPEDAAVAQTTLAQLSAGGLFAAVADALPGASVEGKVAALQLLAGRNATAQASAVVSTLGDADSKVVRAAFKALETVGRKEHTGRVLEVLAATAGGGDRAAARDALVAICRRESGAVAAVLLAKKSATGEYRLALLQALARIGGKDALTAVLADVTGQDTGAVEASVRALADWRDADAAPHLLKLARESASDLHKALAFRGYVRVVGLPSSRPPADTVTMLKQAFETAKTAADRKLVLGALGNVRHDRTLDILGAALTDNELVEEAAAAIVKIACPRDRSDGGMKSPLAFRALNAVVEASKNKPVVDKAKAHLSSFPPMTGKENLAVGKPVSISCKQQANHSPKGVVDGRLDRDTAYWGDRWPSWLQVDLEKVQTVDAVRVIFYWDSGRFYTYTLDVSTDGKTWTQVADNSKNNTPANAQGLVHRFKPVDARYVRVNILKNNVNEAVHIVELEVYAAGTAPKVFASSEIPPPAKPPPLPAPDKEGFIPLFNGKDLTGWMGSVKGYEAKDGVIVCQEKGGGTLLTQHQFADFVLKFEFKLTPGANNGLAIRCPPSGNAAYAGMELQIIDNGGYEKHHNYKLQPWQVHGSIYGVVPAKTGALKAAGEWNQQEVRAIGPKITVILNGTTIVDTDISTVKETADGKGVKAHPGLSRFKGHIGWLGHGAHVEFRNIRVKPLEPYTQGPHNTPPEGFVALFDGKDLSGWKGLVGDPKSRAKMTTDQLAAEQKKADERMSQHWKAEDGIIAFDGKGKALCTGKDYGDFEMYVDWKIGKDGDSGIYVRGSPQIQIWDPAAHPEGSGGLYNNQKNPSKPTACADNPIGQWNRFRILMVGEKVTVWLNSEKVVDNVVMENYWDRSIPIYPTGQIELQNHSHPLWFRNVYVREIPREPVPAEKK